MTLNYFVLSVSDLSLRGSLAVWTGLEPATPCVTGRYSNQLNYHTVFWSCLQVVSLSFAMQR